MCLDFVCSGLFPCQACRTRPRGTIARFVSQLAFYSAEKIDYKMARVSSE